MPGDGDSPQAEEPANPEPRPPGASRRERDATAPNDNAPYAAVGEFAPGRVRLGYEAVSIGPDGQAQRAPLRPRAPGAVERDVTGAGVSAPIEGVPELVSAISDEIRHGGPMTFARFMELALYHPEHGYYTTGADRGTRSGDFLTAPETHPIFGAAIAHQLEEMWERLDRPERFTFVDHGAGTGALGVAVIARLRALDSGLLEAFRYRPVEVDPRRLALVEQRLTAAGGGRWLDTSRDSAAVTGAVMGNELVDALPVHRVVRRDGELREVFVDSVDGRLVEREGRASTPELGEYLAQAGVTLVEGQRAEVRLQAARWIADAAASLVRGYLLIIDYGYSAAELYGSRRPAGTLRAFRAHRAGTDPLVAVGRQDLTAHVDLSAVAAAGEAAGLALLGWTSQAEFLLGLGLGDVLTDLQSTSSAGWPEYVAARAAATRLIDPGAMGGFGVLLFGRGVASEPPLRGLGFRLPPRAR